MEPSNRTPAGDQYSLGCVLYYCLTGRVPFPEGSAVEKMMAHQTKEPVPVKELAPDAPDGLVAVVKKLMAKTAEGRFGGTDEVVEALEPFLGDLSKMPGGVPAPAATGSGRVPAAGVNRSGPRMPGLPTQPPGSNPGVRPLPSVTGSKIGMAVGPTGSNMGMRVGQGGVTGSKMGMAVGPGTVTGSSMGMKVGPGGSHPGARVNPPAPPSARTPPPDRMKPNLPSRSSFQVPTDDHVDPGALPAEAPADPAGRMPHGWADEDPTPRRGFGPVGVVAAALLIMVAAYIGAVMLMR
jgi:serine/threonine-protein kinase